MDFHLQPGKLTDIFLKTPLLSFKKGQLIFLLDIFANHNIFYLKSGFVRTYTLLSSGGQKIYIFYKPGEIFPISLMFADNPRTIFYEAVNDVQIYKMTKAQFMKNVSDDPIMLTDLMKRLVHLQYIYMDRIENLEHTSAYARVIMSLITSALRFGIDSKEGIVIQIPLSHSDIANTTGMSRETASREIEKLVAKKLIANHNHLFIIFEINRLKMELENFSERRNLT